MMVMEALSTHRGGVAIFCCKVEHSAIKKLRLHGPNIISFQLVMGGRRWYVVGCHIYPSNSLTIEDFAEAIRY